MIPHTNRLVDIIGLVKTGKTRTREIKQAGLPVYINQSSDEIAQGFDNQASFFIYKMLTSGNHAEIVVGDTIQETTGKTYEVKGKSILQDLTGTHHQYTLVEAYE